MTWVQGQLESNDIEVSLIRLRFNYYTYLSDNLKLASTAFLSTIRCYGPQTVVLWYPLLSPAFSVAVSWSTFPRGSTSSDMIYPDC